MECIEITPKRYKAISRYSKGESFKVNGKSYRRTDRLRDWRDGDPIKATLASEFNAENPQIVSFEPSKVPAEHPQKAFRIRQEAMGRKQANYLVTEEEKAFLKSCLEWYRQDGETKQADLPSFLNEQEVQLPDFTK